jgi:hypothetical protein
MFACYMSELNQLFSFIGIFHSDGYEEYYLLECDAV